ncbi:MAG: tryptophan-rich sensory protein [Salaquimonas sp.]|jgi:tryptophan-rich sensory protein|nr:tryptophan-rich sensory protein [Salaquimonas sp.]
MNEVTKSALVFTAAMLAIGFAAAWFSPPGEWYAGLEKPSFNPPNWVFAPVWTLLYVLIGISGALAYHSQARERLVPLWVVLALLNGGWSILFFRMQQPGSALILVASMLVMILVYIARAWWPARAAALLFMPYGAWVAFATLLNGAIVMLN